MVLHGKEIPEKRNDQSGGILRPKSNFTVRQGKELRSVLFETTTPSRRRKAAIEAREASRTTGRPHISPIRQSEDLRWVLLRLASLPGNGGEEFIPKDFTHFNERCQGENI